MDKEPHGTGFWRSLGYRGELVTIDAAFFKQAAVQGFKGFFFPVIALWHLCRGRPHKVRELFHEVTRVP